MRFNNIIKFFEDGNVCVTGLRGSGKDMLMSNVAVRRRKPYVSNCDYGGECYPLDLEKLDCGKNTYKDFLSGNVKPYEYPYPDGTDIYISDCGVYFPSQYCNELNKQYPYMAVFPALSRQLGLSNQHLNCQNIGRIWLQLREQSDTYILCRKCIVIFGYVIQTVRIYNDYESCAKRLRPFPVKVPLLANNQVRTNVQMQRAMYEANHGIIKNGLLFYKNKSAYDTRIFRTMLSNGGGWMSGSTK